jgi:adenosylhomocysteine nucleosidase
MILVCFAVKEEAERFKELAGARPDLEMLLTGIGPGNAEKAIRRALSAQQPRYVLSCGFAGGLRPDLAAGTVVFAADRETELEPALLKAGAIQARFHCLRRVAATASEKQALRQSTGADAVEMESQIICDVCREHKIPSAVVRVILDTASEDLPLDFNLLMTPNQEMSYARLALALLKSPGKVGTLLSLQKESAAAAEKLAEALWAAIGNQ